MGRLSGWVLNEIRDHRRETEANRTQTEEKATGPGSRDWRGYEPRNASNHHKLQDPRTDPPPPLKPLPGVWS